MRRSRVYEYTLPNYDKGYVFARNLSSARKKVGPIALPDGFSFYDRVTKAQFVASLDRFGRYSRR